MSLNAHGSPCYSPGSNGLGTKREPRGNTKVVECAKSCEDVETEKLKTRNPGLPQLPHVLEDFI